MKVVYNRCSIAGTNRQRYKKLMEHETKEEAYHETTQGSSRSLY